MNSFSFPVHEEQVPGDGGAATAEQITWSMPEHHAGGAGPWGADPPVATVIGSGPLDCSRHSFHGGLPTALAGSHSTRQDWDWATAAAAAADAPPPAHEDASMSTVLYPSHFPADDEDNDSAPDMDCKPSIYAMQVEALGAGAGASSASHRHGAFSYHHPYSHHHHQHAGLAASARHYDDAGADHTPWPAASIASLAAATGYTSSRNYNSGSNNNIGLDICTPLHGVNYSVPSYGGGAAGGGLVVTSGSSHGINVTGLYSSAASYGGTSGLMNNYLGVGEVQARAAAAVSLFEQRASSQYNVSPYLLGLTGDEDHRRIHDLLMRRGSTLYYSNGAASSSAVADFNARIGLNLGGRTYFSTHDDSTLAARFGNMRARFRPNSPGVHVPSCQAERCRADLSMAKHYHRRHKVCEHHSKASTVVINGQTQRFCQQCSRFHSLSEFDEGKRSCRKRLADHNRRRRKPQSNPTPASSSPTKIVAANTTTSNSNTPVIPTDSLAAACEGTSSTAEPHRNHHDETAVAATAPPPPPLPKSFDQVRSKDDTNCEQKPPSSSLLSTMALVPSVSLTLQQDVNRSNPSTDENTEKDDYEPFMQLSGPSLTLSSLGGHRNGQQPVGHGVAGTLPAHSSGFGEVDLSWLRAVGSSTVGPMQENLGRSAAAGSMNSSGQEVSLRESNTNSCRSREHHHISSSVVGKSDTWSLEANPSGSSHAASRENTVLSLLEGRPSCNSLYKEQALAGTLEERVNNAHDMAAASLGFFRHSQLFDHHTQNSTGSCLQVNNEQTSVGDGLSVQRMQELMPLQQQNHESSIYTTANFMKDGFL